MSLDRLIKLAREASGEENPDVYRYLASESLGVPYSDVTKEQRAEAKRRFYHFLYADYNSEGALPAPVAQPSLEEAAALVARFKAAFPELEQPLLVATPTRREPLPELAGFSAHGYSIFLGDGTYLGRVDRHSEPNLPDLIILKGRERPEILTGEMTICLDFESIENRVLGQRTEENIIEVMARYLAEEIPAIAHEPVPATKMGAQAREPFWSRSWKRKR